MMMTMSELAAELHVSRQQVGAWHDRRARNGFPEPINRIEYGEGTRPVWNLSEVAAWHRAYEPSRGGRPVTAKVS